jgi:bacillolysin
MKKRLLNLLLLFMGGGFWLLSILSYAQPGYKPKYLRENNRALLDLASQTNDGGWVIFREDKEALDPDKFFDRFGETIGLGKQYKMRLVKDEADVKQTRHQRYQLYYKNIPVENVEYILHSKGKRLLAMNGRMVDALDIDIDKPMPEKKALAFALAYRGMTEDQVKGNDKLPKGDLVIAEGIDSFNAKNFRLCYAFEMHMGRKRGNEKSVDAERLYVDAQTGDIVRASPLVLRCFSNHKHKGNQAYSVDNHQRVAGFGQLSAKANFFVPSTFVPLPTPNSNVNGARFGTAPRPFETQENGSQNFLIVPGTDLNTRIAAGPRNTDQFGNITESVLQLWQRSATPSITNSRDWGNQFQRATTAHWLMQRCVNFWQTRFGRNGTNGNGFYPRVLVDMPNEGFNASWSSNGIISYWNNANQVPLIIADISGHEFAHAVTDATCNLLYEGESGAINEALSDIFGTAFERFMFPERNYKGFGLRVFTGYFSSHYERRKVWKNFSS